MQGKHQLSSYSIYTSKHGQSSEIKEIQTCSAKFHFSSICKTAQFHKHPKKETYHGIKGKYQKQKKMNNITMSQ